MLERTLQSLAAIASGAIPWTDARGEPTQAGWAPLPAWNYLELRTPVTDVPAKYPQLKAFFEPHKNRPEMLATTLSPV